MDWDGFWNIVEAARASGNGKVEPMCRSVERQLRKLPPAEVASFKSEMNRLMNEAYRYDLWGAAYIIQGGCSDDGFEYFRAWLLLRGRKVFEASLKDVESLAASLKGADPYDMWAEEFLYIPFTVYEEKTGADMPDDRSGVEPSDPVGRRWDEDELERLFPKLWAAFAAG